MGADTPEGGFSGSGGTETPFDLGDGFRRFADHVPLMMWRTDDSGRSTYHNECWLQFTGRPLADEIGDGWRKGLHPDDFRRHAEIVEKAFESRLPFTVEFRLRRHDGAYRWLLDTGRPLEENGVFHGYLGSCFDITDRKNAEEHAERALVEKETLLAEIYHRVRNNLQVMVSLIGLYGRAAPEACRGSFDALGQRVRAIALVQQHLHEAPHIASIDLRDYLHRLASGLGQLRRAGRIGVTIEGDGTSLVEPRTANALGMIVAEIVAECLDATSDTVTCGIAIRIDAGVGAPVRLAIVSGSGEAAAAGREGVPKLGPRLIAAYAAQAEIAVSGTATAADPLLLQLPEVRAYVPPSLPPGLR
ncbi:MULTISPECIES: PAS domain S-box protein [Methylorubrum]|jgi:PAS domain S-box-containing protein|uniref:histidine kinase n=3 Tax=Methylorubrum TaxID=2282523 RepID=A0A177J5B0_9HYPH|nr:MULTISPECIES: PAS domain S-box protein [Methylorubrum]ACB78685.1 signal transduction histidine kinase [Methylorubrum populi BJ001]KAB7787815.1 Chemotaxis protein methyltransferase CheR [Methylorubrum populi]MBA8915325.1 PAS domain S-box-containing protein [Methylorubrum thiocyanatum]OAH36389.1 histidine kinase [Methylorubrum populi]PZP67545.1 MAG: PAS domain S-box protein [Methylorubrum populi]